MKELISVIIPLYNKENAVAKCLGSITRHADYNVEIIVIDDGSSDNSAHIVKSFQDERIKYFRKPNGGVSSARNLGLEYAKGDWIIYIDADDYFLPDALTILYKTAVEKKVLISTANFYAEKNGVRTPFCNRICTGLVRNNFRAWYFRSSIPGPGAALFHKSVLSGMRFNENLARYEDAAFLFDVIRKQKIAYSSNFVMVYAQDNSQASKSFVSPEKDFIMHMNFHNKSFWERMVLASMLNEGLYVYGSKLLEGKYPNTSFYLFVDNKIRRFRKWKSNFYKFIMKNIK